MNNKQIDIIEEYSKQLDITATKKSQKILVDRSIPFEAGYKQTSFLELLLKLNLSSAQLKKIEQETLRMKLIKNNEIVS